MFKTYKSTIYSCYTGHVVQAVVINLPPILFIPLRTFYGLSFSQMGMLVLVNFVTQLLVDLSFSGVIDRFGARRFAVASGLLAFVGLLIFAAASLCPSEAYYFMLAGTVIFSAGGGLLEVLLSPIVNSIPTDEKAAAMSMLHSFYAWGQAGVILITTLLLACFGASNWPLIVLSWSVLPLLNALMFIKVPLVPPIPGHERMRLSQLVKIPYFRVAVLAILMGGAAEQTMAQWASAFAEKALNMPKLVGDIAGVCLFALMLGLGRLLYGFYGSRVNVLKVMEWGAAAAIVCYLASALVQTSWIPLISCALCGLAVSTLWPGTLVVTAEKFPLAGASMFAILAAGGDMGASFAPYLLGAVADYAPVLTSHASEGAEQFGLRCGMFFAAIFPLCALICFRYLQKHSAAKSV